MKQKKKKPGRPKGLPKTGGRKKGTPNKSNLRMRDRFAEAGFDFVDEVINTLHLISSPEVKLDFLGKLAPYFMQRLREESEETPTPPLPTDPNQNPGQENDPMKELSTPELLAMFPRTPGPEGSN